jgi:hypothetical protein
MSAVRTLAGRLVPKVIKESIRDYQRRRVFRRALKQFAALSLETEPPSNLLVDLVRGWGNEGWSAEHEFLTAALGFAREANGPILECGSGLSTVLLGLVADRAHNQVWSLEHHAGWAVRVSGELRSNGIESVEYCVADLRDFGEFTWYDPPLHRMPSDFALVICDGPPGDTPGGRFGLLPVMRSHLRPGCVILLDDAERPDERRILERWAGELGTTFDLAGSEKPYGVLRVV